MNNKLKTLLGSLEEVEVDRLALGMFVAELDRPWAECPFMIQGFLIESDEEILRLRQLCRSVVIDRHRSIGEHHRDLCRESVVRKNFVRTRSPSEVQIENESAEIDFLSIACLILKNAALPPPQPLSSILRVPTLEEEAIRSAPVIDDIHETLRWITSNLDSPREAIARVDSLVHEMAEGVYRNSDAMLWLARLKSADQYSYDHAIDVSIVSMIFGRFLGFDKSSVECLGKACLMQDIGKTQVDPEILTKPGQLTASEYGAVKLHVLDSTMLLRRYGTFAPAVLKIVFEHHERYDGSGYPRQLSGKQISRPSEIAGLVDTYCAMTRQRIYSPALPVQKALEALNKMRNTRFRASLIDRFIQCIGLYPVGTLVELNSGEVAVVIQQNQARRLKPRVLILLAPDKSLEKRPRSLDLFNEPLTPTGEQYRITCSLPANAYGIDPNEFFLGSQ